MGKRIKILIYWLLVLSALALTGFAFLLICFFIVACAAAMLGFGEAFVAVMMFIIFVPACSLLALVFSLIAWRIAPKRSCWLSALNAKATLVLSLSPLVVAIGIVIVLMALGLFLHLFPGLRKALENYPVPKNQSDLYGIYYTKHHSVKEKLILKADLTYVQEVTSKDSATTQVAKGRWSYNYSNSQVDFYGEYINSEGEKRLGPRFYHPQPGTPPSDHAMGLSATKVFGNEYLDYVDRYMYHKKRGSEKDPAVIGPAIPEAAH